MLICGGNDFLYTFQVLHAIDDENWM